MKKSAFILMTVVIAFALILAACASSAPTTAPLSNSAPATDVPTAAPADTLKGNIAVSGAFALYPMMTVWAEEFQKIHPNVTFDVSAGGAGKGMTDALSGAVDIGMVSRNITSEEEAKGAYAVAVVKDAVFPIVNAQNPVINDLLARGVSKDTFIKIFITGEIKTWGEVIGKPEITDEIHVYTRSDSAGAADAWAKFLGGKKQEDLIGVGVNGDPGELEAIVKDSLGIGYNNLGYAFDNSTGEAVSGAIVLPIDANGDGQASADEVIKFKAQAVDAVATGKYPSPPARDLNVVTNGKPSGLTQTFIEWILTDGQQFVATAGFVQLPADQLTESLAKVK
ncbi:MAG: extracellular solute-binding protein [Chloroflexi bacterium]|nr:extracellular solute-binding protein [Chloroflexota bacterium]